MIQIKANQKNLFERLQQLAQSDLLSLALDVERTRTRETQRIATGFELSDEIKRVWPGAQFGVEVIRRGTRKGKPHEKVHYYLTSWREVSATQMQARIRAHWAIENPLHWVKDVVLGEDDSSICSRPAAILMGFIRNLAITLFRRDGNWSITAAIDRLSNDLEALLRMVEFASG
ncbi:MAG: ISAs1 family transposase [Oculatellaceae cyanobacterium Prado106]|nr:ISAs1 family transposase [Oculatellaceae cyanobacterium Prado106]